MKSAVGNLKSVASAAVNSLNTQYRPVIGLEIHAQIKSNSKMFSSAAFNEGAAPNSTVALFDMAIPGTLPVLNRTCVLLLQAGVKAAVLLNCKIPVKSRFVRKHYFYADMPAGYQITQKQNPIAHSGHLDFYVHSMKQDFKAYKKRTTIARIQLEVDSGKSLHDTANRRSLIDLNRAGVGLLEIVTDPDFNSALEASCFIEQLRIMLAVNSICSGKMHKGELRVDANVSIAKKGDSFLGIRTELKNLSSISLVQSAIDYEIRRQLKIILENGDVVNETRTATDDGRTVPMREKEIETDYRFIPETNLPAVRIERQWIDDAKTNMIWEGKHSEYINEYGMEPSSALCIAKDNGLSKFVDSSLPHSKLPIDEYLSWLKELKIICKTCDVDYPPESSNIPIRFAEIISLHYQKRLTRLTAIQLMKRYIKEKLRKPAEEVAEEENLWRLSDRCDILRIVDIVLKEHSDLVQRLLAHPTRKNMNRLRNSVISASDKRIEVVDAESFIAEKLRGI